MIPHKEMAGMFYDAASIINAYADDDRECLGIMLARMDADELRAAIIAILIASFGGHGDGKGPGK